MMDSVPLTRESFARLVKDALSNFYDPVTLQTHPLTAHLSWARRPIEGKGEALRRLLRESIESLRPEAHVPRGRSEWLGYRVLWSHYVRSMTQEDTCRELGISESTFFRYQRQAMDALVAYLWDRHQAEGVALGLATSTEAGRGTPVDAVNRAFGLVATDGVAQVDLGEVLADACRIVEPLAVGLGVEIQTQLPPNLPPVQGNAAVLHQVFLSVLTDALRRADGSRIYLEARATQEATIWQLGGLVSGSSEGGVTPEGFEVTARVLGFCGGTLTSQRTVDGRWRLVFAIPFSRGRAILIIDDDPQALELYRRYLQSYDWVLLTARTWEDAEAHLAESQVELVLLDVIMPGMGGWRILEMLKTRSQMASIPVIVCSVISQPELALTLGAAAVLNKPFGREDLVQAIHRALIQVDTEAKPGATRPEGT